jgi:hypothetical protein
MRGLEAGQQKGALKLPSRFSAASRSYSIQGAVPANGRVALRQDII